MGKRSRRKPSAAPRGYARSEERNEAARQALEPLPRGERPGAVTVAAVVAFTIAVSNVGLHAAGAEIEGAGGSLGGVLLFAGIMLVMAWGMWQGKYWAVLGFQALLGITLLAAGISLTVVSNLSALALCLAVLALGGWLFWKLVRAMARIQMPERPSRAPR